MLCRLRPRIAQDPDHDGTPLRIEWIAGVISVQMPRDETRRFGQGLELVAGGKAEMEIDRHAGKDSPVPASDFVELGPIDRSQDCVMALHGRQRKDTAVRKRKIAELAPLACDAFQPYRRVVQRTDEASLRCEVGAYDLESLPLLVRICEFRE